MVSIPKRKRTANVKPLHQRQAPAGLGLIVSSNRPIMQNARGRMELVSKIRSRNLSIGEHSCTDSRRKTITTPRKSSKRDGDLRGRAKRFARFHS